MIAAVNLGGDADTQGAITGSIAEAYWGVPIEFEDKALTYLSATRKTEKEIRRFLAEKGYLSAVVEYVLEKLRGYDFVNDEEYAEALRYNIEKKCPDFHSLDRNEAQKRINALMRLGFSAGEIIAELKKQK